MNITEKLETFKKEVGKVMVGQEEIAELIFVSLLQRGHILFESVPGTGKTMLSKTVARAVGGTFKRIQFTPDILPSDITGLNIYNPKTQEFELRIGPIDTNILLADEINRATPRTQSALLEVMGEKQVTIDGERINIAEPFIVLATQNPIESSQGNFDLPEAQLDRFLMKIDLGYPSREEEKMMLGLHGHTPPLDAIAPIFTKDEIVALQNELSEVEVNDTIEDYLLDLIHRTREHEYVEIGVSPRGTLALIQAAKGVALIRGRGYVIPEDIKYIAPFVISHRLVLNIEGSTLTTPAIVAQEIIDTLEVPVEYGVARNEV
ncbi:AAA family ATPase [Salinicoccus siamensis]|uniref:AAA family ATPase n=1 Tax=Salinicoccus siamensis TaxID=381830 RepID=A0ABV5Z290_9STAP